MDVHHEFVTVGGVKYTVTLQPFIHDWDSCADAERHLGITLNWRETSTSWEGFHPVHNRKVATVRKTVS